ncbi:MAG: replication factor C large subunit [Candidatus Diapherotrites archaeon]
MPAGSELWTGTFLPKDWNEFVGNSEIVERAQLWAKAWNAGKKQKPLLLYGGPGNGKTTLAILLAKTAGWSVFELNASDFRNKDSIERMAGAASQGASFSGKPRLVLLDEVDGLQAADRGGAGAISQILKESQNPVILTANNIYEDQKLAPIRAQCELLQLKKINYLSIAKRLREICTAEGIQFEHDAIELLAKNSSGDFRSALLDLQTLSLKGSVSMKDVESMGGREREENIFATVRTLFKAKTIEESRKARFKSEVDSELLARWVEENIPTEFDYSDTARAFDFFSRGDIFEGRIFKRQDYGMRRYSMDLMTACAPLSREKEYHGWTQYQFPQLLRKLSASLGARYKAFNLQKSRKANQFFRARGDAI